jgi:transposase
VDVSSRTLAARIGPDGARNVFPNTVEGIGQLAAFCHTHRTQLVAMEATGGYEQQPFTLLSAHGLAVAILNPRQVRRFAQSVGRDEKTDAIDAGLIAWFAQVRPPRRRPPTSNTAALWSRACASSPTPAPRSATSAAWSPTPPC